MRVLTSTPPPPLLGANALLPKAALEELPGLQALGVGVEVSRHLRPDPDSGGGFTWRATFVGAPHDMPLLEAADGGAGLGTTAGAAGAAVRTRLGRPANAVGGTFTLGLGASASRTTPLGPATSAADLAAALEALPEVGLFPPPNVLLFYKNFWPSGLLVS